MSSIPAQARTWTINPAGTGDFPTLQAAIQGALDGDTIFMEMGTYTGPGNWDIPLVNRDLTILGEDYLNPWKTVISCEDGGTQHRGLYIDGGAPVLQGFAVRHGLHTHGAGIYIAGGTPEFHNVFVDSCHALSMGGGVYVTEYATPEFEWCNIRHNTADIDGGGLVLNGDTGTILEDCIFYSNQAFRAGGGVRASGSDAHFTGCTFSKNDAGGNGGAIECHSYSDLVLSDCRLNANSAEYGACISCTGSSIPLIRDTQFYFNEAILAGGGLYCSNLAAPVLTHCSFIRCSASAGGTVYCTSNAAPDFRKCLMAWGTSSAFDHDGTAGISLTCCDIYGHTGGDWVNGIEGLLGVDGNINLDPMLCDVIWSDNSLASGSPCLPDQNPTCGQIGALGEGCDHPTYVVNAYEFTMFPTLQDAIDFAPAGATIQAFGNLTGPGNRDLDFGGKDLVIDGVGSCVIDCQGSAADPHRAFHFHSGETTASQLTDLTIRNGYASQAGGAILIEDGTGLTIHKCTFTDCISASIGGAIDIDGTSAACACVLDSCHFEGNAALSTAPYAGCGGGIYAFGADLTIQESDFLDNAVTSAAGAVEVEFSLNLVMQGCSFIGNQTATGGQVCEGGAAVVVATPAAISGCTFATNAADQAGALYVRNWGGELVELAQCIFEQNEARAGGGGALWVHDFCSVGLNECFFALNSAEQGGAIDLSMGAGLEGYSLEFEQNHAVSEGGAVHQGVDAGNLYLEECAFDSDAVTGVEGRGGALWLGAMAALANCSIASGTIDVAGRGGGIFADSDATVGLEVCALHGNHAQFGGGIYAHEATLNMHSCQLYNNTGGYGAAAYLDADAGSEIVFTTARDNIASSSGGGFYFDNVSTPTLQNCTLVGNGAITGGHIACRHDSYPEIYNTISAFASNGAAVSTGTGGCMPFFTCSDIYGNTGGDWTGAIAYQQFEEDNFCEDPLFCDVGNNDLTLYDTSPCLPENSPCGGLVGAYTQGCTSGSYVPETFLSDQALGFKVSSPYRLGGGRLAFALPEPARASLDIFDANGRRVRGLISAQQLPAGYHEATWDGRDAQGHLAGPGIYFFKLTTDRERVTRRVLVLE